VKKVFIVSLLILFLSISSSRDISAKEQKIKADPFPGTFAGQHIYYHDMRRGVYRNPAPVNRLVGFLKTGHNQYIIRVYDLSTGEQFLFFGYYYKINKNYYEFNPENIKGDPNRAILILTDLMNVLNYYGRESFKKTKAIRNGDITLQSDLYGKTQKNHYKKWIPFYGLYKSVLVKTKKESFTSVILGRTNSKNMLFFKINSLPPKIQNKGNITFTKSPKQKIITGGVTFHLDDKWRLIAGNSHPGIRHDTYWISKFTKRDCQIGVEIFRPRSLKTLKNERTLLIKLLHFQQYVKIDTISFGQKNISFSVLDVRSNSYTRQTIHIIQFEAKKIRMINFSAYENIYRNNKKYFNKILSTYKVMD